MTRTVLLGDLLTDLAMGPFGSNLKVDNFIESGIPVVKGGNLYGYEVGGDFSYVSEEKAQSLKRSLAYPEDVVITHRGTLGQVSIIPRGKYPYYLVSQSQLRLTPNKEKINPRYLLYYLRSTSGQHELMQHAAQVGVPSIATPTKAVKSFKILLPDLGQQEEIVNILGTIDEKIEVNRKMNETLEQMGRALFRHYFIDNPEAEKWEEGRVSDLIAIYSGYAFKRTDFDPDGKYGLVTIKNVQDGNFLADCSDYLTTIPAKVSNYVYLKTGDVLLSLTGNVGRVCITYGENLLLNQRVAKLVGMNNRHSFAYFMFRQNEFKEKLISMSRGTAQLNLSPVETKNIKAKLPSESTLDDFYAKAEPLFERITANYQEIQTLTTLRDTLLPHLISGKVKV